MSIWRSIDGPDILALNNDGPTANYHGQGEPTVQIDVAITGHHELVRLALFDGADVDVLLAPDAVRALAERLLRAVDE